MNTVGTILTNAGWRREADHQPSKDHPTRQVYSKGDRRAYVGSTWATFYTKVAEQKIEDVHSVRVDAAADVKAMAGVGG